MVDRSQTSGGISSYRRQAARKAVFAPFRFHDLRHLFALRGGIGVYALGRPDPRRNRYPLSSAEGFFNIG
jgi:hypothetical protein